MSPIFPGLNLTRVETLNTLTQVALEVNRWCGERLKFKPTQRRDQGPLETLRSGYGRCEELMITYIMATRSVGVPCRNAFTPWWAHQDNNHAWVEVWNGEQWQWLGAAEPKDSLSDAWFTNPAKRAALVFSVAYGRTGGKIYRKMPCSTILNSTACYSVSGTLKVKIKPPEKGKNIYVSVFNYGTLRPIARLETNINGEAEIELGDGTYFVSVEENYEVIEIKENIAEELIINTQVRRDFNESFWLHWEPQAEADLEKQ